MSSSILHVNVLLQSEIASSTLAVSSAAESTWGGMSARFSPGAPFSLSRYLSNYVIVSVTFFSGDMIAEVMGGWRLCLEGRKSDVSPRIYSDGDCAPD